MKLHHPDAHAASGKGSAEANKERFLKIQKAYECLGNEKGRGLYLRSVRVAFSSRDWLETT